MKLLKEKQRITRLLTLVFKQLPMGTKMKLGKVELEVLTRSRFIFPGLGLIGTFPADEAAKILYNEFE